MNKRIALLAMVGTVLVFTFALVLFSVYTVNTAVAATMNTAPLDHPATMNAAVTTDRQTLTNLSTDSANTVEVSVQHIGTACHGDATDAPAY
jgi:hypothetical protein